jgi:hypothetical protein
MPMYEVELRRGDAGPEVRLTDQALAIGDELVIEGRMWRVESMDLPKRQTSAVVRYVCRDLSPAAGAA